jgi:hypothetical protein
MITELRRLLLEHGVPSRRRIHTEAFFASTAAVVPAP